MIIAPQVESRTLNLLSLATDLVVVGGGLAGVCCALNAARGGTPRLQAEIDFLKINSFSSDLVLNDAHDLQNRWPLMDRLEKRKVVECLTNQIVIGKDEISLDLIYLPSSKELSKREWSLGGSNP